MSASSAGLPREYFERLYVESDDPWSFQTRWYERRKRALTMASLPRAHYSSVLELGCSIGLLSSELIERADHLVAVDISEAAVGRAREFLAGRDDVRVQRADIRDALPTGPFDLVVVSEVAYYLSTEEVAALGVALSSQLADYADVVLCHWRHPVSDYPLDGDDAQRMLIEALRLHTISRLEDEDLILEVVSTSTESVATREGLI